MTTFQFRTSLFVPDRGDAPQRPTADEPVRVDVVFAELEGAVEMRFFYTGEEDDPGRPVEEDVARLGMQCLMRREARLEAAAGRFGMVPEALLRTLEETAVDVADPSSGIPDAERDALLAAHIDLSGSATDPSGAAEVAAGLARVAQFRDRALSVSQAARRLDKTDGRVRQMVSARQLATMPQGESGYLLPDWQFVGHHAVPGLARILESVGEVHPLALADFMTRADVDLDVNGASLSPVAWLIGGGDPGPVAELATGLGAVA